MAMIASDSDRALRVCEIDDESGFQALKESWNKLAESTSAHVFLRHEWFDAAWAWRRADAALGILCVSSSDRLVGILPSLRPRRTAHNGRLIKFLTVPDTQFCDLLVEPQEKERVCRALADHLVATAAHWDALHLECLPPNSIIETALLPVLSACGLQSRLSAVDQNLFVDLRMPWLDYYAARPRSLRKSRNLAANRLSRSGRLDLERIGCGDFATGRAERLLDELISVSEHSWKNSIGISLDRPGPGAFIRRLTDLALRQGWLSVWILRFEDRAIAMEYQLVYKGQVHALRADFDERYRGFSPGTYLNFRLLEGLFADGFERYYMGPGRNVYKRRWSSQGEAVYALTSYAPTSRGNTWRRWSDLKSKLRGLKALAMLSLAREPSRRKD